MKKTHVLKPGNSLVVGLCGQSKLGTVFATNSQTLIEAQTCKTCFRLYSEAVAVATASRLRFAEPTTLTESNYYEKLGQLQNFGGNVYSDIMSFTALLDWAGKVKHYSRYYESAVNVNL